jgi:hypothetical protein
LLRADVGRYRRMPRRDGNNDTISSSAARVRQTGSGLRLRFKEVWIGNLDWADIVTGDDHVGTAFREMPQSNGKVIFLNGCSRVRLDNPAEYLRAVLFRTT